MSDFKKIVSAAFPDLKLSFKVDQREFDVSFQCRGKTHRVSTSRVKNPDGMPDAVIQRIKDVLSGTYVYPANRN